MDTIRILAVDDEKDILESYQNILVPNVFDDMFSDIAAKGSVLFGDENDDRKEEQVFELVSCHQGDEAVEQVKKALAENKPFAVAFVDIRMAPGPDGVWTAQQIHELDSSTNIVIVTAHSDVPPHVIAEKFHTPARLFYIQKPFHWDEIYQFAVALSENWKIQNQLQEQAEETDVEVGTDPLFFEQGRLQDVLAKNVQFREELDIKTRQIEEVNTALRVLLHERDRERRKIEDNIMFNINEYVSPYLTKLKNTDLDEQQETLISVIEKNLASLTSTFSASKAPKHLSFTPVELQVAKLIKHGRTTKEIAELLSLSTLTVESYRKNIRKKMGITNRKENLRTTLLEYF